MSGFDRNENADMYAVTPTAYRKYGAALITFAAYGDLLPPADTLGEILRDMKRSKHRDVVWFARRIEAVLRKGALAGFYTPQARFFS